MRRFGLWRHQRNVKGYRRSYTTFFDPEETKSFAEDLGGSFEGIGAELGVKDAVLTIIAPLENSPAEKAGLRAGDKIIKIGDKATNDMTVYEAVNLLEAPKEQK